MGKRTKSEKQNEPWNQQWPVAERDDVMTRWAGHWRLADQERGGCWRPILNRVSFSLDRIGKLDNKYKTDGLLVNVNSTYNLYFEKDLDFFSMDMFYSRIKAHPLTALCQKLEEKPKGQYKLTNKGEKV